MVTKKNKKEIGKTYIINGILVNSELELTKKEAQKYVTMVKKNVDKNALVTDLNILKADNDEEVILDYKVHQAKFERIRRITGYLSGTTDSWNDAKKAELNDRVKHV